MKHEILCRDYGKLVIALFFSLSLNLLEIYI